MRLSKTSPPNAFIGGLVPARLDSRQKHAGMTDFGTEFIFTQRAAGESNPERLNPEAVTRR